MTIRNLAWGAGLAIVAMTALGGAARAAVLTIDLGPSAEDVTLYGLGETSPGSHIGTYSVGLGASSFDGTTSTFTLSGTIIGGDTPGQDSGTYEVVTTYLGADAPTAGPNAPQAVALAPDADLFNFSSLDPSTQVTLFFQTPDGSFSEPLVQNGAILGGVDFGFIFANSTCTGLDDNPCSQHLVGDTPGATITGQVIGAVSFDAAIPTPTGVPEPAAWAMMLLGFAGLGAVARSRPRFAPAG